MNFHFVMHFVVHCNKDFDEIFSKFQIVFEKEDLRVFPVLSQLSSNKYDPANLHSILYI